MHGLLKALAQPFPPSALSWKPGSSTKDGNKCMALAYADLRAYQERLDEVCGLDWSCRYVPWEGNRIICELTIYVGDALGRREPITRASTGEADTQDEKNNMAGSVSEAMAFKRAAAMFGLGRYLYELPSVWVEFDAQRKRITDAGKAELDSRYKAWYNRETAHNAPQRTQDARTPDATTTDAATPQGAPGPASKDDEGGSVTEPWYAVARANLANGTAAKADQMLDIHRNGDGACTEKQYQFLAGLIDSLPGVGKDGHSKVLSVICQSEISSSNRPSFDLATKLLDYLPTHTKVDGNKVANPNYRADIVEHITKIANALQMELPLAA